MGRERPGKSGVIPVVLAAAGAAAIAVPLSAQASSAGGKHRRARNRQQAAACSALESSVVEKALASLHPDHRQVLVETYFLGSSVAEAAAALGIPATTVKSRAFHGLKALKLALQEQGLT